MFSTVLGCCDKDLLSKVRNRADFDSLDSSGDNLGLLNVINQEGCRLRSAEYAPVAYHPAQVKFYPLSLGRDGRGHTMFDQL